MATIFHSLYNKVTETVNDFVDTFFGKLENLKTNDFIAKQQAKSYSEIKANLSPGECTITGDFSMNYSFLCQNAIQGTQLFY